MQVQKSVKRPILKHLAIPYRTTKTSSYLISSVTLSPSLKRTSRPVSVPNSHYILLGGDEICWDISAQQVVDYWVRLMVRVVVILHHHHQLTIPTASQSWLIMKCLQLLFADGICHRIMMLQQCLLLGVQLSECISAWFHSVKVYNFTVSVSMQVLDPVGSV